MTTRRNIALVRLAPAVAAALLCGPAIAGPGSAGPDRTSREQAVQRLAASGYTGVTEISGGADYWEVMAVKDGRIVALKIDPRTGAASDVIDDAE